MDKKNIGNAAKNGKMIQNDEKLLNKAQKL